MAALKTPATEFNASVFRLLNDMKQTLPAFKGDLLKAEIKLANACLISVDKPIEYFTSLAKKFPDTPEGNCDFFIKNGTEFLGCDAWTRLSANSQKSLLAYLSYWRSLAGQHSESLEAKMSKLSFSGADDEEGESDG